MENRGEPNFFTLYWKIFPEWPSPFFPCKIVLNWLYWTSNVRLEEGIDYLRAPVTSICNESRWHTKAIQKVKSVCAYSPRIYLLQLIIGFWCDVENCLIQLYVGPSHVVSAEIAVAMAVPIENPADYQVPVVVRFLQADEILCFLAEVARSRVELFFCCTRMQVRILPGKHKAYCVCNSIGISSSILRKIWTWHRRTFSCYQKWNK